jgi:8-amino-7-oxononanoate synthase
MSSTSQPIAIIGMGCRYPDASHPGEFWRNQQAGLQSFGPVDPRRWDHSRFYTPGRDPDGTPCDRVAHLRNVEYFAASHFGIAPRRAEVMDPQQRLLLEVTWEAVQDAGLRHYDQVRSAAYVGCSTSEYKELTSARLRERQMLAGQFGNSPESTIRTQRVAGVRSYTLPGQMLSMNASVISQFFNWGGPSLSLDGACASSLLAVHEACLYLQRQSPEGPAPIAVAAGAYLNLVPDNLIGFSRIGALAYSPSSAFDISANGFTLGEGVGALVLKRLDQAERDGDRIYAIVRGTYSGSDGEAPSPMTPCLEGQVRLLREALAEGPVAPADLGYLECHGTATPVGDQIELQAWREVLQNREQAPWIGSIKSNFGHTISAAGIAGLMRAALACYHASIPPHAGWSGWHPELQSMSEHFQVPTQTQPWNQQRRVASVSSFAFGGINCLALIENHPQPKPPAARKLPFVLSAPTPELLELFASQLLATALEQPHNWVAYTLSLARTPAAQRRLLWASNRSELEQALRNWKEAPDRWEDDLESYFQAEDRHLAELPPTPLQRKPYWVVSQAPQADYHGLHERQVREWLARNCGCAPTDFKPEQHLIDDLGLDSLALRDLLTLLPPLDVNWDTCTQWTVGQLLNQCRLPEQAFSGGKLTPASHPFLLDHALEKTMLLPLASGLDFLAWSQNLQAPWSLHNVRVHRGLMFREQAEIRLEREEMEVRLCEIRNGGRKVLGISAQLGDLGQPPESREPAAEWDVSGELKKFYEEGTFHGTRLQGIASIQKASEAGVVGMVRTSVPRDWVPGDPRLRWHLDPLVIDSCLQLALYLVKKVYRRPVLPSGMAEITLQTQLTPGLVEARVVALPLEEEGPAADVFLFQNGRLVGWIRKVQSRWVQSLPQRTWQALPAQWTQVSKTPEIVEHQARLATLKAHNPYFKVPPVGAVNFCHYNYVGLARHPRVLRAAAEAVQEFGCSAQASRLVGGEIGVHGQLESDLAHFLGQQEALVLVGGHATNTNVLSHWMQAPDLILHDSLSHNSILEGAQASHARRLSFPHNDTEALEKILRKVRTRFRRVLLVVEGVYSMDGDIAPLPELVRLKQKYGCLLMVDEAHSLGILGKTGRGICEHFNVPPEQVDLLMGTLSKTLGSCGGYLSGTSDLISYFRYSLPGFVYSVGLSPPLAASARAALQILRQEPERVEQLRQRSKMFWEGCRAQGLPLGTSQATPVIPIILGDSAACATLSAGLAQRQVEVKPIVYPAVEEAAARIRFFLSSEHTPEQLTYTLEALRELLGVGSFV